ncbi:hypothetical protein R3P38DRAFT_2629099 [Favolaschia claudopus]|uniref:Nephrocystin 3-like N-terminal domain-containing protein n=1 Tax=Favolaschia claudopus TaxID=2862362 RepID=A0AAW0B6U1_9AGAR
MVLLSGAEERIAQLDAVLPTSNEDFRNLKLVGHFPDADQAAREFDFMRKRERALQTLAVLKPREQPSYPPDECLPGTRINVLADVIHRLLSPSDAHIVVLSDVEGSGKTTVVQTVAEYFRGLRRLAARLFVNDSATADARDVIKAVALGMAQCHPHIETAICNVLSAYPKVLDDPIDQLFKKLLLGPLEATKVIGPFVIVIDGINAGTINHIVDYFTKLPAAFRFFVTCRRVDTTARYPPNHTNFLNCFPRLSAAFCTTPNDNIWREFWNHSRIQLASPLMMESDDRDISVYIHTRLNAIIDYHTNIQPNWPPKEDIQEFIRLSGNLFLWAAVALDFIQGRRSYQPYARWNTVLEADLAVADVQGLLETIEKSSASLRSTS